MVIAPRDLGPGGESSAYLKLVTDSLPVLIAHCDREGRYLFVNKPYSARFHLEPDALVGRTIEEVVGRAAYAALRPYLDRVLGGEDVMFEVAVPYADLGVRVMRCHYVPV